MLGPWTIIMWMPWQKTNFIQWIGLAYMVWTSQLVYGKTLRPIRNTLSEQLDELHLGKRSVNSLFDLQSHEEFLWGDDDDSGTSLGRLTVHMTNEYENILNAEKFWPLLKSLGCASDGLRMVFNDDVTFERAKGIWDWANGEDDRHFIMVIGAGDCGWNDERQPYLVRTLDYEEEGNVAKLMGEPRDWSDIAHSYDLDIGSLAEDALDRDHDDGGNMKGDGAENPVDEVVKRNAQSTDRDGFITEVLGLEESDSSGEDTSEADRSSDSGNESDAEEGNNSVRNSNEDPSKLVLEVDSEPDVDALFSDEFADGSEDDIEFSSEGKIQPIYEFGEETISDEADGTKDSSLRKSKELSKPMSIPFRMNLPLAVEFKDKVGRYGTKLRCMYCGTRGRFDVHYKIQRKNWLPTAIIMTLNPRGIEFYMGVKWHIFGVIREKRQKDFTLATMPLPGSLVISKLVEVGPELTANWAVAFADLKGQTVMAGGVNTTIPDNSIEVDLLHPWRNNFDQWSPVVKPPIFKVESRLSAKIETFIGLALNMKAVIMDHGYNLRLEWKSVYLNGKVEYVQSDQGVCQTRHTTGVKYSVNWGTTLGVTLKEPHDPKLFQHDDDKALYELKLGSRDFPMWPQCVTWRNPLDEPVPSNDRLPIDIPVKDPTDELYSGIPCTISGNTKNGTCLPTSNCLKAGGVFERDGCSGPDHIQCCYVPEPCRQSNGATGQCIATLMCANEGRVSEPGHCPGPEQVQCCV